MRETTWWAAQVSTFLHPTKLQWMHNAIERVQFSSVGSWQCATKCTQCTTRYEVGNLFLGQVFWNTLLSSPSPKNLQVTPPPSYLYPKTKSWQGGSANWSRLLLLSQIDKRFFGQQPYLPSFFGQPYLHSLPVCCCSVVNLSPHSLTVTLSIYWSILLFWIENTISTWACLSALSIANAGLPRILPRFLTPFGLAQKLFNLNPCISLQRIQICVSHLYIYPSRCNAQ